jgi:hypothetical protein
MRPLRLAIVWGSVLAVAVPAAHASGPSPSVPSAHPAGNSLWYRLSVSVRGTYELVGRNGTRETQTNTWNLTSNTAIIVKRVCVLPGSHLSAEQLAISAGLPARQSSCDDLRRALPRSLRAQFGPRLRDDFSVNANAHGSADAWTRSVVGAAHDVIHDGKTTTCPAGARVDKQLSSPAKVVGSISGTALNGISAGFAFPDGQLTVPATETRAAYECRDDTGKVVEAGASWSEEKGLFADVLAGHYAPVHGGGNGGEFETGPLGLDAVKVGNPGHLFGRSFTLSGGPPRTHTFTDGTSSTKTVTYTIRFELCPNGGRNVRGC